MWEELFAEEVEQLWEPWMRVADELLEDEVVLEAVYEAQGQRHPQSRERGVRASEKEHRFCRFNEQEVA
jgi:hypothetical protein